MSCISVLIPDGESAFALPVLQCLAVQKDVKIYAISSNPRSRIRYSRHLSGFFLFKGGENLGNAWLSFVKVVLLQENIDVLLPVDESTIRYISSNRDIFKGITSLAPLPDVGSFDIAVNKWTLAQWVNERAIPCPLTLDCSEERNVDEDIIAINFPVLLKPKQGSGGKGIEFYDCLESLFLRFSKSADTDKFILQSFIHGYDIDCSVLCKEGEVLAHTVQKRPEMGNGRFTPAPNIDFLENQEVLSLVKEVVRTLNWNGVVHFDLRYDESENRVKIIEMNCRFWASITGSLGAGVNFPYLSCLVAKNIPFESPDYQQNRFVNAGTALKIKCKDWFGMNKSMEFYDRSSLEFILRDPIPFFYERLNGFGRIFKNGKA
ncbi:MAG: ATP-grasp domain-containing protein [Sediminicola sp.]